MKSDTEREVILMINKYITDGGNLREIDEYLNGAWISLISPSPEECLEITRTYGIDISDVRAALDQEESSRIDTEEDYIVVLFDIPSTEIRHKQQAYTTIPLGIIWTSSVIITICSAPTQVLDYFIKNHVRGFSTKKQVKFCYQILLRTCLLYQADLRIIDKKRIEIEEKIRKTTDESDIVMLHELESNLVYFDTSLRANRLVLERISRYSSIKKYPEDRDLLEDVIVENQQAIEMAQIYRDIMRGTRELMSSLLDSKLNNVMKTLASITILMAIPTIVSGLYGMNVNSKGMPLAESPWGFGIICVLILIICITIALVLKKRKML
mgnify:CR=1 FL=1